MYLYFTWFPTTQRQSVWSWAAFYEIYVFKRVINNTASDIMTKWRFILSHSIMDFL